MCCLAHEETWRVLSSASPSQIPPPSVPLLSLLTGNGWWPLVEQPVGIPVSAGMCNVNMSCEVDPKTKTAERLGAGRHLQHVRV